MSLSMALYQRHITLVYSSWNRTGRSWILLLGSGTAAKVEELTTRNLVAAVIGVRATPKCSECYKDFVRS